MDRVSFRHSLKDIHLTAVGGTLTVPVVSDYVSRAARVERLLGVDLDDADLAQVGEHVSTVPVTRGVAGYLQTAGRRHSDFRVWRKVV